MPPEFAWDEENEEHISRHDVAPYEAEEAMTDPERIGLMYMTEKKRVLSDIQKMDGCCSLSMS